MVHGREATSESDVLTGPPSSSVGAKTPWPSRFTSISLAALVLLLLSFSPFGAWAADFDGDGVEDESDNCPYTVNSSQYDSGGVLTSAPDGIGDACQCGDTSASDRPDMMDVVRLRRVLEGMGPELLSPEKCDVESSGPCDADDLTRLREALAGMAPGLEQVCTAAQPQPICGDELFEYGERCDGTNFGGATCESLGHVSGVLACTASCAYDASGCLPRLLAITVGDSIVHDLRPGEATAAEAQGWMHVLPLSFATGEVAWLDRARSGESTKSFRDRGYWDDALAEGPRWIVIQFGHNDARLAEDVHTDPNTTYRENLHAMVIEARAIGAEPIFVTPPPYFYANAGGFLVRRPNGLEPYVAAMQAQAAADSVGVVELHAPLMDAYDEIGIPLARKLYSYERAPGVPDLVHFSVKGASKAVSIMVPQFVVASPSLATYLLPD